ncbi:MAG TPA: DNA polymerase Y family protein [Caulobacteraceae bacterium]|nr:DNA polymerase Y family protein [Caulobacteraceae bacterium]
MRRVVSLYLPTWPTDRWRRRLGKDAPPAEAPVVLIGRSGSKRLVLAANEPARGLGIYPGAAAARAQAIAADLTIQDADTAGDQADLERLALWALKSFSPIVAPDPPDGLVIDATGAAHLKGGEAAYLEDLIRRLGKIGVAARAAMSGSWGSAHALARYVANPTVVVDSAESGRAIAGLPLAALRLPADTTEGLSKVGFDVVGEVEAAARAPLVHRFGPQLIRRLDQAYGRAEEPIEPVEAPELVQVRRAFAPEPIGAPETLARYTVKLVQDLCLALEEKGLGVRVADLRFHRVDNRIEVVRVATAKPVRDLKRLSRLLCDKIETVDPGFGVEQMVLTAVAAEPLVWKAQPNVLMEAAPPDVTDLIDTLANRLGRMGRLYRLDPGDSFVPERSVQKVEPTAPPPTLAWPVNWPRPTRLLARPEPVIAMALLPDQPPTAFTWRGQRRRVIRADGPERVHGEWWRRPGELWACRDYFQLETESGERFWVFRRGDGEWAPSGDLSWYMHGLFG